MADYEFSRTETCSNCDSKSVPEKMIRFKLRINNKKQYRFLCSNCFAAHVFPLLLTEKERTNEFDSFGK